MKPKYLGYVGTVCGKALPEMVDAVGRKEKVAGAYSGNWGEGRGQEKRYCGIAHYLGKGSWVY